MISNFGDQRSKNKINFKRSINCSRSCKRSRSIKRSRSYQSKIVIFLQLCAPDCSATFETGKSYVAFFPHRADRVQHPSILLQQDCNVPKCSMPHPHHGRAMPGSPQGGHQRYNSLWQGVERGVL